MLRIDVPTFLGPNGQAPFRLIDALPPNLESLMLRGYQRGVVVEWDHQLDEFEAKRAQRLPKLTDVTGIDSQIPACENFHRVEESWDIESLLKDLGGMQ